LVETSESVARVATASGDGGVHLSHAVTGASDASNGTVPFPQNGLLAKRAEPGPFEQLLDWDGQRWTWRSPRSDLEAQACQIFASPAFTPSCAAVARLLVARYRYWISPNGQAEELRKFGINVPRSALARLLQRAAAHLEPLADRLRARALKTDIIAVANHSVGMGYSRRLWVYVALPSMISGGPADTVRGAIATFRLTPDRHGGYAAQELPDFRGYFFGARADGYDAVLVRAGVRRVGCWSEIRRMVQKFDSALNHAVSVAILRTSEHLQGMENELKDETADHRLHQRRERAPVHLEQMRAALVNARGDAMTPDNFRRFTSTLLADWDAYTAFLDDGRIALACTTASDVLKRYRERRGWVFGKDRDSYAALANMETILETCRLNGINANNYLTDVLTAPDSARWPLPLQFS
jgi:hypothetical protein